MEELRRLAGLVRERNQEAGKISSMFGQADQIEELGEFIASRIFGISIASEPGEKSVDNRFTGGELAGRTVSVKWYARNDGRMAIRKSLRPDFYLVLTGPKTEAGGTTTSTVPWTIDYAYLFRTEVLLGQLRLQGVEPSGATKIRRKDWKRFELYPEPRCPYLTLSEKQKEMVRLFGSDSIGV